jgi:PAS domain S-box-containing protein
VKFWTTSLMVRLVSYFLVLSLVTVALVGYIAYTQATEALKLAVFDRLSALADVKEGELNRWVADEVRGVELIASQPEIRAQASTLLAHPDADATNQAAHAALVSYLSALVGNEPGLQEVFILSDVGGRILVSTDVSHEGQYRVTDRYFTQGKLATFVQNVYPSPITLAPTMTVATPLLDMTGQRLGVLAVHLNLKRMDEIIQERIGVGASNEAYLVDRLNVFVSGERFGRLEFPRGVHTEGIDAAVAGNNGAGLYANYAGVPVLGVYRSLPDRDLALLVEIHQDEAFAPAGRLALTTLLVGLFSAGVLAVGVYLLARQIARPILAITRTATQVASGDLTPRAPVLTDDEVGVLARAFNSMTEQLRSLYDGLEAKVSELKRTEQELVTYKNTLEDQVVQRTAELQQAKEYFESLVLNSPVAIITRNLDGTVVSWNPAAEKLFGYTESEAVGHDLDGLVATGSQRTEAERYSWEALAGNLTHALVQRTRKDGSTVDLELLAVPVIVTGRPVGTIVVYHDISELQRARHDAEAANQAKSAFLATMSHEIRTPMNAVIGMSGLLLTTELSAEQREYAEIVRTSGESLLTIINDILDFSKIEAGKMDLEQVAFDLHECLDGALDLVAIRAGEKGLDVAYIIDDDVPGVIVGDVTRLRQIVVNLLNNSIKFTEHGEVVVSVAARRVAECQHEMHFTVRDTGIGISVDGLARLFQPFSQVDLSTSRKYGGTGLGLAISKRLCELMGGTMWVENTPGEGATFAFTIVAESASSQALRAELRSTHPLLSGKRLLIVDDNATTRRIVVQHVRAWGMLARDTASPIEALEWLRRGDPFDVAILDSTMPEMDGAALAAAIRQLDDRRGPALIIFSALGRRDSGAEHDQFAGYLSKPLKPSHLLDVLMNVLAPTTGLEPAPTAVRPMLHGDMAARMPARILVAEDNAVNQKLALLVLGQLGYQADVAGNGLEAITALERQRYDVVLMDVQMPELDGLEAARLICQRWPPAERPRIVAMTANAMQGDRELCLDAGMDDYISKPIRTDELVAALCAAFPRQVDGNRVTDTDIIDRAALDKLLEATGGDQATLRELINSYLLDAAALLDAMRKAVCDQNTVELRRAAHTLKSTSASFGARPLIGLCHELEQRARDGILDGAEALVAQIDAVSTDVERGLRALNEPPA